MSDLKILSDLETAQINGGLFNFTPITSFSRVRNSATQTATGGSATATGGGGLGVGGSATSTAGSASNSLNQTGTSSSAVNVNYISLL
jgi:hypothetical protein